MLLPNIQFKTFGGSVFWDTLETRNGWKLQQNAYSGHYRILDPLNIRQAWSYDLFVIQSAFRKFTRVYLIE